MWNPARCIAAMLAASFAIASSGSAVMEEDDGESEFVRTGFYLGVGGTASFGHNWNSNFDDHQNEEASDLANENAQNALDLVPPPGDEIVPLSITVDDSDLEDAQFGLNGVLGYRAGALVAFEIEGEWVISKNDTDLDVDSFVEVASEQFEKVGSSSGSHSAEVDELWAVTANVKVYPPFDGWLRPIERFQPFVKVGLGVLHSRLVSDYDTSGLTTMNTGGTVEVPADFRLKERETQLAGAVRVGGGIDIYATRNIVSEINATYVIPFSDLGFLTTDYVSVQWRLVYRF